MNTPIISYMNAQHFVAGAYISLMFVLVIFIALSMFSVFYLIKTLRESKRQKEEIAVYSRAVLLAQEVERSRISRELHDTIISELRYLALETGKISRTAEPELRASLYAETASMQTELITKVRDICEYLVPPDFRIQGLPNALRNLCLTVGIRAKIDCRMVIEGETPVTSGYSEEKRLQIFRIVQEASSNAVQHAGATVAIVTLREDTAGDIYISITDDGKGFDAQAKHKQGKFGIRGMNERAAQLGGVLTIISEIGEGTTVRLYIKHDATAGAGSK